MNVDAKGKFAIDIGATLDGGIPGEVFSTTAARWIGIAVKGEIEQPRIMIVSVPYAVKARDAETIGGKTLVELMHSEEFKSELKSALKEITPDAQPVQQQRPTQVRQTIFTGLDKQDSSLQKEVNLATAAAGTFQYLPTTGLGVGVIGRSNSVAHGTGPTDGSTGVQGEITASNAGAYSAGVRGINNGTFALGIGVVGYQNGSGWGVLGQTPSGIGVYGYSSAGTPVLAGYGGSGVGTAIELSNGAIKVSGTNRTAFTQTLSSQLVFSASGPFPVAESAYVIDNPVCNDDPNAIVFAQTLGHLSTSAIFPGYTSNDSAPVYAAYVAEIGRWCLFHYSDNSYYATAAFNILVIKQ